jgi:protein-disulfide isomerase
VCLLAIAAGSRAQTAAKNTPDTKNAVDAQTTRRIEVLVRAKLNVPSEYEIALGPRTPSDMKGFDTVQVTFSLHGRQDSVRVVPFLLSADGNRLVRIYEWDIDKNPATLAPSADRPVRGNPDARVVIVNYDDLECPFCAKMHAELFPETLDHYKGLVKIVYRDLPLEEIHPWAVHAAVNANCLAAQSATAYWSYVDYLHVHGQDVSGPDRDLAKSKAMLDKLAYQQGEANKLDAAKLDACIAKQDEATVRTEMKQATSLGIDQTPTLYVNGEVLSGALPQSTVWTIIDRALVSEGITPPANELKQPTDKQPGPKTPAAAPAPATSPVTNPGAKPAVNPGASPASAPAAPTPKPAAGSK